MTAKRFQQMDIEAEEDSVIVYKGDGKIHRAQGTFCDPAEDRTRQEGADSCDINKIVDRMARGILPTFSRQEALYADMTEIGDLHESLERVRRAEEAFMSLPAAVRTAFDNDVAKFTAAFQSDEGVAKLRELKVVPETEETLLDRREAAFEERKRRRADKRAEEERVRAAVKPPGGGDKPPV